MFKIDRFLAQNNNDFNIIAQWQHMQNDTLSIHTYKIRVKGQLMGHPPVVRNPQSVNFSWVQVRSPNSERRNCNLQQPQNIRAGFGSPKRERQKQPERRAPKMPCPMNIEWKFWYPHFGTLILVIRPRPKILPKRPNPGLQGLACIDSF